jgi:hypothetical protein
LGRRTSGPLVPTDVGGRLGFLGFAQGVPGELVGFGGVEFGVDCWAEIGEEVGAVVVEDEGEGLFVFGAAGGEVLEVGGEGAGGGEVLAGAPGFGVDVAAGGPAFVGEVGDLFGEGGVGTVVEAGDAVEGAVDEEGFKDELVPGVLGEVIAREGVVEGDGVVNVDDVGAGGFAGVGDESVGVGEVGEGLEDDDGLADIGGAEELGEGVEVEVLGLFGEFEEEDLAGGLVGAFFEVAGGAGEGVIELALGEGAVEVAEGELEEGEGFGGGFAFEDFEEGFLHGRQV